MESLKLTLMNGFVVQGHLLNIVNNNGHVLQRWTDSTEALSWDLNSPLYDDLMHNTAQWLDHKSSFLLIILMNKTRTLQPRQPLQMNAYTSLSVTLT